MASKEQKKVTDAYRSYPAAWLEPLVGSFALSLVRWTRKLEVDWVGATLLDTFEEAIFLFAGSDDNRGPVCSSAGRLTGIELVLIGRQQLDNPDSRGEGAVNAFMEVDRVRIPPTCGACVPPATLLPAG